MRVPIRLVAPLLLGALSFGCGASEDPHPAPARERLLAAPTHGVLRVSLLGGRAEGGVGALHRMTYVAGTAFSGVDDNDIRGFLDGGFLYGWNQPLQTHVRVGRRRSSPRYGETELFRVLMRWSALGLPADAVVERAALSIGVEWGNPRPLRVVLYAVRADWEPGRGGDRQDNNSPPEAGDVWWGARAHEREPWGLPGAGFASDVHPAADTPGTALAATILPPDSGVLRFESAGLARELQESAREGRSLRLLIKLSDDLEDDPDTQIYLYSAEHGDQRNPARRPRLEVDWRSDSARTLLERRLLIESGRRFESGPIPVGEDEWLAASFESERGSGPVTLEVRDGPDSAWRPILAPLPPNGAREWELRALAAENPVALGRPFSTWLRDTWLPSGPPDEQEVGFVFQAPSGARHQRQARHTGDYRFEVEFTPDELGVWRYHFEHSFEEPYRSAAGSFHVLALERSGVVEALEALLARAESAPIELDADQVPVLAPRFWQLERGLLALETPESFATPAGRERRSLLGRLREVLGGRPLPDPIPLRPAPRDW
jgi:hypothetical protein